MTPNPSLYDQLQLWLAELTAPDTLWQLGALGLVFLLAGFLGLVLNRVLVRLEHRIESLPEVGNLPWIGSVFEVTSGSLWPLGTWILAGMSVELLASLGRPSELLQRAVSLLGLWLLYRIGAGILSSSMPEKRARGLTRFILRPIFILAIGLSLFGRLDDLLAWGVEIQTDIRITISSVLAGLLVLFLFLLLARGGRQFLQHIFLPGAGFEPGLNQIITTFTSYAITLVGLLAALSVTGINLTTLTVIAGGLSVGLGFGLQELISNFVSGFILLFERSIGPGDIIQVGDTIGTVQTIGIRSTQVTTRDNIELIVPNSRFLTEIVTNFTREDTLVRLRVAVGVSYKSDPRQVEAALLEASRLERILAEPAASVQFTGFGDSSLEFVLLAWTNEAINIPVLSSELRYRIWNALAERGIEIPFPQRDLHIRSAAPFKEWLEGSGQPGY